MTIIDNIALLGVTSGVIRETVYVKCHTLPGDGGCRNFVWKAIPLLNRALGIDNETYRLIGFNKSYLYYAWIEFNIEICWQPTLKIKSKDV